MTPEQISRLPTAYHESGHCTMAFLNDARVHAVTCIPKKFEGQGESCGHSIIDGYPNLEARVRTCFGGPLAELRFRATAIHPRELRFDLDYFPGVGPAFTFRDKLLVPYDPQTVQEYTEILALLEGEDAQGRFQSLLRETKHALNRGSVWEGVIHLAEELAVKGDLPDGAAMIILKSVLG